MTQDDEWAQILAELELSLDAGDPEFIREFNRTARRAALREIAAFALLAVGAVAFVSGLATSKLPVVTLGVGLLLSSLGAATRFRRRRTRRSRHDANPDGDADGD